MLYRPTRAGSALLLLAAASSGVLEWASYPPHGADYLAWVCLIPLFVAMEWCPPSRRWVLPAVWALTLQSLLFWWLRTPPPYAIFGGNVIMAGFLVTKLPAPLLVGWALSRISAPTGLGRALQYACAWCALEYLETFTPWGSLWGSLAVTQIDRPLIQVAALGGPWLITALIVFVNASIACCAAPGGKGAALTCAALALLGAGLGSNYQAPPGPTARSVLVGLVQPNISFERKLAQKTEWDDYTALVEVTRRVARERPDLVVWPETGVPWQRPWQNPLARACMLNLQQQVKAPLLVGTEDAAPDDMLYNGVWLIEPGGTIFQHYIKNRLLFLVEYVPFFARLRSILPVGPYGGLYPGNERHVFTAGELLVSPLVCLESSEPLVDRSDILEGANLIAVLCNDGFTFNLRFAEQHFQMARLLAVETHRPVIQVANTGISGSISARGEVLLRSSWYEETGLCARIALPDTQDITLYVRLGDYLAWLSLLYLGISVLRAVRATRSGPSGRGADPVLSSSLEVA